MKPLQIDVWSDIACPWCWIGKRNLEAAIEAADFDVATRWHAFELDPNAPREAPERVDYAARLAAKYRSTRDEAQAMIDRMVETGRARGVEMRFDLIRPSSTFDAHRLLAWAVETSGAQTELKERLFAAYLGEGRSISDPETLARLAEEAGLDRTETEAVVRSGRYAETVRADEAAATRMGIDGVPAFVFEHRLTVTGAQPPEQLRDAMERALALREGPSAS